MTLCLEDAIKILWVKDVFAETVGFKRSVPAVPTGAAKGKKRADAPTSLKADPAGAAAKKTRAPSKCKLCKVPLKGAGKHVCPLKAPA